MDFPIDVRSEVIEGEENEATISDEDLEHAESGDYRKLSEATEEANNNMGYDNLYKQEQIDEVQIENIVESDSTHHEAPNIFESTQLDYSQKQRETQANNDVEPLKDYNRNAKIDETDESTQYDQYGIHIHDFTEKHESSNLNIHDFQDTSRVTELSYFTARNNNADNSENDERSRNLTKSQPESDKHNIKKIYTDPKSSFTVHLCMRIGVRIEYRLVPQRFYMSDVEVLLLRDLGLRHASFILCRDGNQINPLTSLESLADKERIITLDIELLNTDEIDKFCLGSREVTFRSGLTIKAVNKKSFVSDDPLTHHNILKVIMDDKEAPTIRFTHIDWLPPKHHKPFLGGYRNVETAAIFHNASTQTIPPPRKPREVDLFSRDTQTYRMKHFGQDTVKHNSTQFTQPGFYVANYRDRVITPGPYESADEYLARVLEQVIIIQKYVRRWLAKKKVDKLRKIRDEYLEWEKAQAEAYKKERANRQKRDLKRRLNPKTTADFDRLFNALEQWRREEIAKIDAQSLTAAERKAALAFLLDEETELIAAIGRHQQCASIKGRERLQHNLLKKAAAPHQWTSVIDNRMLEVATAETLRGKELLDIFETLKMQHLTRDERLDILLTLKRTIGDDKRKLSKEIVELIDREAELIMRGIPDRYLTGLRQRIVNRFVQYAKLPEVNPEIAQYLAVPTGKKETAVPFLKGNVFYCLSCDRYLKSDAFPLSARSNRLAPCESCRRQDNRARTRFDLQPYMRILIELRQTEIQVVEKARQKAIEDDRERQIARLEQGLLPEPETTIKSDGTDPSILNINPFPFLINKEDVKFLIDEVWEKRSILSGRTDIDDLILTRWRQNEPWSPWNTILVTREEADAHAKLGKLKLEDAYADAMLSVVKQRLLMGQNAFPRLFKNGVQMSHEELIKAIRLQYPENTPEWLKERRQMLPPLTKIKGLQTDSDDRHKPTYQPPEQLLPAIRGAKRWSHVVREEKVQ